MAATAESIAPTESSQYIPDILQGSEPGAIPNHEPLFELPSDEELDISVDDICAFPEAKSPSTSEATTAKGRISSFSSSHGSASSVSEAEEVAVDTTEHVMTIPEETDEDIKDVSAQASAIDINEKSLNSEEARKTRAQSIKEMRRESEEEDVNDPNWVKHKKHVFVFSDAGKPIYSRYGNEDKLATLMGVMQAIVSFVQDDSNQIRCVTAGKHKIVFLLRGHVILVAVAQTQESVTQLILQLSYAYNQILSVLTHTQLSKVMEQRRNYDLRRLLSGTEKFIDNLLNLMDHEPSFLLGSVRCLPLSSSIRDIIGQSMLQARVEDLVFAILVAKNQLVTLVRPKKYSLHPSDLHLIFNLVSASTSFQTAESWTPICLPRFDNSGYLYAHISYLQEECPACLLLLSTDRSAFFELAGSKQKILEVFAAVIS